MPPTDSYYYSPFHIARDFVGNIAPFTFFLALATLCFPDFACAIAALARAAFHAESWVMGMFVVGFYVALALMSGILAERMATLVRDGWRRLWGGKREVDYWGVYSHSKRAIGELYARYITASPATLTIWKPRKPVGAEVSPQPKPGDGPPSEVEPDLVEQVDRLCAFFKIHNPVGFRHLYRDYTVVFMFRQCVTYLVLLAVAASISGRISLSGTFASAAALSLFAIRRVVRNAVDAEYQFILATASWLEQERSPATVDPKPPGRGDHFAQRREE